MAEDYTACNICFEDFTFSGLRVPRVLPCGHTLCSACIPGVQGTCPTCRSRFAIEGVAHPINRYIIDIICLSADELDKMARKKRRLEVKVTYVKEEVLVKRAGSLFDLCKDAKDIESFKQEAEKLLKEKGDENVLNCARTNDETCLIIACRSGNLEAVDFLLGKGVDVNRVTTHGWTALMTASFKGNTNIVRRLLQVREIDLDKKPTSGSYQSQTALGLAQNRSHLEIAAAIRVRQASALAI